MWLTFHKFIKTKRTLLTAAGVLIVVLAAVLMVSCHDTPNREGMQMINGQWVSVDPQDTGQSLPGDTAPPDSPQVEGTNPQGQEDDPPETVPVSTGRSPDGMTEPEETEPDSGDPWWGGLVETRPPDDEQSGQPTQPPNEAVSSNDLLVSDFSLFSGQYPEDGRDELVENVAAILVTNRSDRFLDVATLTYDIDGKTATFVVTGLPPGRSAWVMEASKLKASHSSKFVFIDSVTSYRDDVVAETDRVSVTAKGNMLTAVNNTGQVLENVTVYYRSVHTDGNFFGGITYLVSFGTIGPGQSVETMAGHFDEDSSEIVRIGWQDG